MTGDAVTTGPPRIPHAPGPGEPAAGPTPREERSLAPDLARGSVLLFIALANVSVYHFGRDLGPAFRPVDGSPLDSTLDFLVSLLVDQRSYPMFAILFGYGTARILARQRSAGRTGTQGVMVVVRRNLWLLAFGAAHALLLFFGDILGLYAVTGLLVLAFVGLRTRTLLWIAGLLSVVTLLGSSVNGLQLDLFQVFAQEDYLVSAAIRLGFWVLNVVSVAGFALVAPMLIGVVLARTGLLDRPSEHRAALARLAAGGMAAGAVGGLAHALHVAGWWDPGTALAMVAAGVHGLTGLAAGLGYVCAFALVGAALQGRRPAAPVRALAATGERSLTCYLLQSVMLAPVMSAWGLGWGADLSSAQAYLLALSVWLVTVVVAVLLAAVGRRGPAEALLRRLTYGRAPTPTGPRPPAAESRGTHGSDRSGAGFA